MIYSEIINLDDEPCSLKHYVNKIEVIPWDKTVTHINHDDLSQSCKMLTLHWRVGQNCYAIPTFCGVGQNPNTFTPPEQNLIASQAFLS
jgi:hypothetical protein